MTAESYLDQIKKIDFMIKNKLQEYQRWVEAAESIGGAAIGERVQSSRNLHRGADAIGKYIDIEQEIEALKRQRQHIIETIERLPSAEYEVICMLFVQDYSMKEIAYQRSKSYAWVKCKKSNGLKLLQDMLDRA